MKNVPSSALGNMYREHINYILNKDIQGLLGQYSEDALLISSFEGLETDIAFWAETENPKTLMLVEAIKLSTPDGAAQMRFADSWVLDEDGRIKIHFAGMTQYPDGSVA